MKIEDIIAGIDRAEFRLVPIEEIVPWEDNPRDNDDASGNLAEAIREVGYGAPVVLQKSSLRLVAGHTRRKAGIQLGLPKLPSYLLDIDDETAAKMALADNRQSEFARWRPAELHELLGRFSNDAVSRLGWQPVDLEALAKTLPNFEPAAPPEKRLDETTPITCPECGHEFHRA